MTIAEPSMENPRRRRWKAIVFTVCVAAAQLGTTLAHAGAWTPFGPADGGRSVGAHPTIGGQAMVSQWTPMSTWFTDDGGAHWSGSPWRNADDRPVLAGTPTVAWMVSYGQLSRSTDRGRSWRYDGPAELMWSALFVAVNPADPGEIVLVGPYKLAHTRNAGASWGIDLTPGIVQQASVDWTTRRAYVCLENEPVSRIRPHPGVRWTRLARGRASVRMPDTQARATACCWCRTSTAPCTDRPTTVRSSSL
ncbi:MAG: hypothetical protein IPI87_18215 [Betaproteobacteria bacterium]|nr:hypothetical protein [Betaproteobacteria bacterium]